MGRPTLDSTNEHTHLGAPIPEMDIRYDLVTLEGNYALQAFPDDAGAQMADMHRLGDIWSAIVYDNPSSVMRQRYSHSPIVGNCLQMLGNKIVVQDEINKAGAGNADGANMRQLG